MVKDSESDELLALKVMRKYKVVEREMILHTNIELKMMKELDHPFIVKLHYSAQTDERLYLSMEYLEGGSLFDLIRTHDGPFSVRYYCNIYFKIINFIIYIYL